jgi:hypothetical protein
MNLTESMNLIIRNRWPNIFRPICIYEDDTIDQIDLYDPID